MKNYKIELTGITPILFNEDSIEKSDILREWLQDNKDKSVAGDDRTPPWGWQCRTPHDGENVAIPHEYLMSCLRKAGSKLRNPISKNVRATLKTETQTGLTCLDPFFALTTNGVSVSVAFMESIQNKTFAEQCAAVKKIGSASLFCKRVKIMGRGKASKHVRVRLMLDKWKASGIITVMDTEVFTATTLAELVKVAGLSIGLGDWRPGGPTPGVYGRFEGIVKPAK